MPDPGSTGPAPRWPVVLWDLDGTLVDTIGLIVASYQHAFTTVLGHPWDEDEIKSWIGQSLYGAMKRVAPAEADEIFRVYTEWNVANTPRMVKAYPGIPELVRSIVQTGVRTGVVTSKRQQPAEWALELVGLDGQVPVLVSHDDVEQHKPSPEPLLLGAQRLGVEAADCVYVGDAAVDVQAARNAGMACVAVTWGAGRPEDIAAAGPDVTCHSVADLRSVLLGGGG
ncbi:MAG: HAD-IA family hydrolase [Micropruina sp.]|nr:MAG: HAD-IA family hydrolase [Micropruina sp.]